MYLWKKEVKTEGKGEGEHVRLFLWVPVCVRGLGGWTVLHREGDITSLSISQFLWSHITSLSTENHHQQIPRAPDLHSRPSDDATSLLSPTSSSLVGESNLLLFLMSSAGPGTGHRTYCSEPWSRERFLSVYPTDWQHLSLFSVTELLTATSHAADFPAFRGVTG